MKQPELWHTLFKTYDVRGTVPDQLDAEAARTIGLGLANYLGAGPVAVGRDMRLSSLDCWSGRSGGVQNLKKLSTKLG